jgi:hypothetical protein
LQEKRRRGRESPFRKTSARLLDTHARGSSEGDDPDASEAGV